VDQTAAPAPGTNAVVGAVATIEVTPADAEALNLAQAQGDLSLTLRSYADITGPSGRTERRVYAAAGAPSASLSQPQSQQVRVWRGGQSSDVTLSQAAPAPAPAPAPAAAVN
jgi:pilus assembly protein CpaB